MIDKNTLDIVTATIEGAKATQPFFSHKDGRLASNIEELIPDNVRFNEFRRTQYILDNISVVEDPIENEFIKELLRLVDENVGDALDGKQGSESDATIHSIWRFLRAIHRLDLWQRAEQLALADPKNKNYRHIIVGDYGVFTSTERYY